MRRRGFQRQNSTVKCDEGTAKCGGKKFLVGNVTFADTSLNEEGKCTVVQGKGHREAMSSPSCFSPPSFLRFLGFVTCSFSTHVALRFVGGEGGTPPSFCVTLQVTCHLPHLQHTGKKESLIEGHISSSHRGWICLLYSGKRNIVVPSVQNIRNDLKVFFHRPLLLCRDGEA